MIQASVSASKNSSPLRPSLRAIASASALLVGLYGSTAWSATQSFSAPGQATYAVPAGTTLLKITVASGGGGGGGADAGGTGGAGGAGRQLSATLAVQGGESADVFVGAGGAPGVRQFSDKSPTPTPGNPSVGSGQGGAGGAAGAVGGGQYSGSGGSGGGASYFKLNASLYAGGGGGGGGGSYWYKGLDGAAAQAASTPASGACGNGTAGAAGVMPPLDPNPMPNGYISVQNGGGGGGGGGGSNSTAAGGSAGLDQKGGTQAAPVGGKESGGGGGGDSCAVSSGTYTLTSQQDLTGPAGGTAGPQSGNNAGGVGAAGFVLVTPVPALSIACTPSPLAAGQAATCTVTSNVPLDPGQTMPVPVSPQLPPGFGSTCTSLTIPAGGTTSNTCTVTAPPTLPATGQTATVSITPSPTSDYTTQVPSASVKVPAAPALPQLSVTCTPANLTTPGAVSTCTITSDIAPGSALSSTLTPTLPPGFTSTCGTTALQIPAGATSSSNSCTITAPSTLPTTPAQATVTIPASPNYGIAVPSANVTAGNSTPAATGAQPVPTNAPWALASISGLIAWLAFRRRKQQRSSLAD